MTGSPIAQPDWERCTFRSLVETIVDQRNCNKNLSCLSDLPFALMVLLFGLLGKPVCFPINNLIRSDPTRQISPMQYGDLDVSRCLTIFQSPWGWIT